MSRTRQFQVSGLNIRVHSKHAPDEYLEMWKTLHSLRRPVPIGSAAMMIGEVRLVDENDPLRGLFGYFYRFLNIDPNDPWFNIVRQKRATDKEVANVNIPDDLKPNLKEIPYYFDVKRHKLYFVSKGLGASASPSAVNRLVQKLAEGRTIVGRFGKIDSTVITDKAEIDALLSWPVITRLVIKLERPNPVDVDDEERFFNRLQKRGLESETTEYKKAHGVETILADAEMKAAARVAADNGLVEVTGKNPQFLRDQASSENFPKHVVGKYDPSIQTMMAALIATVIDKFK